jgi:pyruvate/2-oxoglutarate dehydrogenase complex dihydrolipoamide acyltransferase (E2) component
VVRRLAEEHGIDLATVHGTGVGGRVSKADVLATIQARSGISAVETPTEIRAPAAVPAPDGVSTPSTDGKMNVPAGRDEVVHLSPIRKMIADRMVLSATTIPHAATIVEVDMTNVVRYREGKKDDFRRREGVALSYVAFVIKATVESLKEYPDANSEWAGDHILRKGDININVAVDAPDGLTTPVIHHADRLSLTGLSASIVDLAQRARSKKLRIDDMQGGTFTVNNTGALGSVWSLSIINPPQCGMLAAAAIVKRPMVIERDGQDSIAIRSMMNLTLSFDHRILDGGYASAFLNAVKNRLEQWPAEYPLY